MNCNYCNKKAVRVGGDVIYPHRPDLAQKQFYQCAPCSAYVGCHPSTIKPLGRLANAELRRAKQDAHAAFDPLWKGGAMKRTAAYKWLAESLGLPSKEAHVGMFDVATCNAVVAAVKARTQ